MDTVTFLSASEGMVRVFGKGIPCTTLRIILNFKFSHLAGLLGGIVAHVEPFLDNHIKVCSGDHVVLR